MFNQQDISHEWGTSQMWLLKNHTHWSQTPHFSLWYDSQIVCIFTRLLRNTSYFSLKADKNTRECSVLSFPLEIIWSQEQNIKTSIKHGQSNWVSVITLSWFIEAQFKLSVQWNAASFGADVGNSFVSSFQLEFQPVFALLSSHFFCLFSFEELWSRRPPLSELNVYY